MFDILLVMIVISFLLYFKKAWDAKDFGYVALGLSRVYLFIMMFLATRVSSIGIQMVDVLVALLVVISTDMIISFLYLISRKYLKIIAYRTSASQLKNLQDKFALLVEASPIGFFTLDMTGKFEFFNTRLKEILEVDNLSGKNIFDFMDGEVTSGILVREKFSYPNVRFRTGTGKFINVQLVGGQTQNGHRTITGSVHPLN